jgi:hypothetical protein
MLFRSCFLSASLILLSFQAAADTLPFSYSLINLGSGDYQYDYTIYNNGSLGATVPVQLFDVFFDPALYSDLSIVTPSPLASQWAETIFPAGLGQPADFDVLAQPPNGGIPVGGTASGFAVDFTWLGQGQPGFQPFQISDSGDFALLQSGNTINPVPLGNFAGGTASNPAPLQGSLVGSVSPTIGGSGSQDYYSFLWAGGAFNVTASINGTTGSFSYGSGGNCSNLGNVTLNGGSFTGTFGNNGTLAAGQYCIGIDATSVGLNPTFGLTFNTPVEGIGSGVPAAPEPSTITLLFVGTGFFVGAGMISVLRRKKRSRQV